MKYISLVLLALCLSSLASAFEMPDVIGTYSIKTKVAEPGPAALGEATLTITNINATDLVVAIKEREGFLSFFKVVYIPARNLFEAQRYMGGAAHTGYTPYPDYSMDFSLDPSAHTIKGFFEDELGNEVNFEGTRVQQFTSDTTHRGEISIDPEIYDGAYEGKSSARGASYSLRLILRSVGARITSSLIFNQSSIRMETHFSSHVTDGILILTSGEYPGRSWVQFRLLPITGTRDLSLEYIVGGIGSCFSNVVMKKVL